MNDRKPSQYSYCVLRYVHDVATGESINVGVLVYLPETRTLEAHCRRTIKRLKDAFPDLRRDAFLDSIHSIERSAKQLARAHKTEGELTSAKSVGDFASAIGKPTDSSFQWAPVASGYTRRPEDIASQLFERYVARYDVRHAHRLTDDEVWRPFREELEERGIADRLRETTIAGTKDEITFKHAWKNGRWNCYQPISLDLADEDGIREKARRWLGHLTSVADSQDSFQVHLIIGVPRDARLISACDAARAILEMAPGTPQTYLDTDREVVINRIEDEVRAHDASGD